ncbi:MAG: class I SAM-dependent methyltransferase [Gammaproteobacteria bacterium]
MKIELHQSGRAGLDFAASLARATNQLNRRVGQHLAATLSEDELADDLDARAEQVDTTLGNHLPHGMSRLTADWLWRQHGSICIDAFDEVSDQLIPALEELNKGQCTLTARSDFEAPDYFTRYWFHNTTGGWDGHDFMGTIQAELVHRRYVTAKYGSGLRNLRLQLLDQLPAAQYARIFEMGVSGGYYTEQLAKKFPDATILGCDVSRRMLEHAQRVGNEAGHGWELHLAAAEDTGQRAATFDLVTSYALFHELPAPVQARVWREAHRLLRPGGVALMADGVPHLDHVNKAMGWRFTHDWRRGGEPYARDFCTSDDAQLARDAGFVDVHSAWLGERPFPRYTIAHKRPTKDGHD